MSNSTNAERYTPPSNSLRLLDGIWRPETITAVSYPKEGNDVCFQIEDGSYWFNHRNQARFVYHCLLASACTSTKHSNTTHRLLPSKWSYNHPLAASSTSTVQCSWFPSAIPAVNTATVRTRLIASTVHHHLCSHRPVNAIVLQVLYSPARLSASVATISMPIA